MSCVIEAVDAYRRDIFWRHEEGIERLWRDPEAWAHHVGEREAEAGALRDGHLEPQ